MVNNFEILKKSTLSKFVFLHYPAEILFFKNIH